MPDSPAEKAGLKRGDLVIESEEVLVPDPQTLLEFVDKAVIGEPLLLKVLRNGREMNLSINPAPLPSM